MGNQNNSDFINAALKETDKSILIIEARANIVIGAPHHATGGTKYLPCLEHTESDENTGFIAQEIANSLNACSIIACNYTIDPNNSPDADYYKQIIKWMPSYLIEIHGHGGKKVDQHKIEISSGKDNKVRSEEFGDILNTEMQKDELLKPYSADGRYDKIHFKADKTPTINDSRWLSFHIELPPKLRVVDNKFPDEGKAIIKALIATIEIVCTKK